MAEDSNISPLVALSVANSVYSIMEQMQKMGLSEDDLITLIQRKVRTKISRTQIKQTLNALEVIEKNFLKANKGASD